MAIETDWHKGSSPHGVLWTFYFVTNAIGAALCLIVLIAIKKLGKHGRKASDVFIGGLCWGCIGMSTICATQCLLDLASGDGYFSWGPAACDAEAYGHVAHILMQFFCIGLVGFGNYLLVVHRVVISTERAVVIVSVAYVVAGGGTLTAGRFSNIYLMPAGNYCFYKFTSPAILFWFVPCMLIALVVVIFAYTRIFAVAFEAAVAADAIFRKSPARRVSAQTVTLSTSQQPRTPSPSPTGPKRHQVFARNTTIEAARKTIAFVLVFFIGWGPAVAAAFYGLFIGEVVEGLDTTLAVFGSLHSVCVPIVYGYLHVRLRYVIRDMLCPTHTAVIQTTQVVAISSPPTTSPASYRSPANHTSPAAAAATERIPDQYVPDDGFVPQAHLTITITALPGAIVE